MKRSPFLRSLRHPNYRLFFIGQAISLIGTWMTQVATAWLVYRLTGSALLLGVVGFSSQIAAVLVAPLAGVLSDRGRHRRILVVTQILSALQSLALAVLALSGTVRVGQIIALSVVQGIINSFDIPTRQAFLVEMVGDRADLGNAIALNSSVFNGARLLGPCLAGFVIAAGGEGICFLIDSVSYLAVIATLLMMRLRPHSHHPPGRRLFREMGEGFAYAMGFLPIRALLLLVAFSSLVAMPYGVLLPAVAKETLHGGPSTFGFLTGMSGLGALIGSLYLASRQSVRGLIRLTAMASGVFGVALMLFAAARVLWAALLILFVIGFSMLVQMAASNTVLQTLVEDDKRGRVMSLYLMAFMGLVPWGSLLAGFLATRIGLGRTLFLEGAACLAGALVFARQLPRLRSLVRPIYVRMGIILPEVTHP